MREVLAAIEEKKGTEAVVLRMDGLVDYTDWFVIATGQNARHVIALADAVDARMRTLDVRAISREGVDTARWVLLDHGTVVTHLFLPEARAYYDLEGLWADAPRARVRRARNAGTAPRG